VTWTIDGEGAEIAALDRLVELGGLRVLEVGAGDGRLTLKYAARTAEVLAVEPDEELVADARAALPPELADRVRFEAVDILELESPPASYDAAVLSWSL
jgi:16S rRNA A1518/A1519 N6-dimethyltransferase RsmA/KsgA/DIM1 with predicted DNA glycosylase/AP lyase activity